MSENKNQKIISQVWEWIRSDKVALPVIKWLIILISAIAFASFLSMTYMLHQFASLVPSIDPGGELLFKALPHYSEFGSFMGGTLGTATAAFGLWLLYINLRVQMDELSKSNSALAETTRLNERSLKHQTDAFHLESVIKRLTPHHENNTNCPLDLTIQWQNDQGWGSIEALELLHDELRLDNDELKRIFESEDGKSLHHYFTYPLQLAYDLVSFFEHEGIYHQYQLAIDSALHTLMIFRAGRHISKPRLEKYLPEILVDINAIIETTYYIEAQIQNQRTKLIKHIQSTTNEHSNRSSISS